MVMHHYGFYINNIILFYLEFKQKMGELCNYIVQCNI